MKFPSTHQLYLRRLFIIVALLTCQYSFSQSQRFKGYPDQNKDFDVLPGFIQPPKGYGNVPFYWWNGDSLNRDRLKEQLEILASSATDGFSVSYMHLNPRADVEDMKEGYGLFGNTEGGKPEFFSSDWWEVWSWFAQECANKNLGLGLDDYTVGWTGNGYYPDDVARMDKFRDYQGELVISAVNVKAGAECTIDVPDHFLTCVAWPGMIDLKENISGGRIRWTAPTADDSYKVYTISTRNGYLIHPDHGKEMVKAYFDKFEEKVGAAAENGMNYFFQDEMLYPITIGTWSEDFAEEFMKRKGYDILPFLPALQDNIGTITPKIRLDYCDVLIDLAESRYMKPIYDWHAQRGLIYGSDNLGRGLEPLSYVDYFRINSWYTAPGNDAPAKGSSFLQTKVSSSIAHLNQRPRTWLEAFHSMGWGSTGAWLTQQIDHHMIAGGNLVCMHGLYYSTHGGWWEWAPPCFHFRMPYWPHMKKWLEYTERMSYLLSQGVHVCDIAIMYPTESMQAYPGANPNIAFEQALKLSRAGLDYDFIDYTSLQRSQVGDGVFRIGDEQYKVLVLADMKAMHYASLKKVLDFYRAGGIILATGELPKASSRQGESDDEVDLILNEIFGPTNAVKGVGIYVPDGDLVKQIHALITPDFKPGNGEGKVLHRRMGYRDVYMVMDVEKGSECFFHSKGKVEIWNASTGETEPYPILRQDEQGTWLKLNKESHNSYLLVFSPGQPVTDPQTHDVFHLAKTTALDGLWEVELLPTLDNKWGDFRLPPTDEFIAAEARSFKHLADDFTDNSWIKPDFDDSSWPETIYGFGEQIFLHNISKERTMDEAVSDVLKQRSSGKIQEFSWQYGVWDNPGSQGYHGLKAKVSDGFLILDQGSHQIYETYVYAPRKGKYRIETEGTMPDHISISGATGKEVIELSKGWHRLIIAYADTRKMNFKPDSDFYDPRGRSAVVLLPQASPFPPHPSKYDKIISMRWGIADHLYFDPYKGRHQKWNYRFQSAPGVEEMEFTVAGKNLKVWFNGKPLSGRNISLVNTNHRGINTYRVLLGGVEKEPGVVAFSLDRNIGYQGASAVCEPVKLKTSKGLLQAGDWSRTGALKYYSGGMYYRKEIEIPLLKEGEKLYIDLGNVVSSCEVEVNGQSVGILMSPPYEVDITKYLKPGTNNVQVLVYSTLSNHYQTIPSPYRGEPVAGMLGPVRLKYYLAD